MPTVHIPREGHERLLSGHDRSGWLVTAGTYGGLDFAHRQSGRLKYVEITPNVKEPKRGPTVFHNVADVAGALADDVTYMLAALHVHDLEGGAGDHLLRASAKLPNVDPSLEPLITARQVMIDNVPHNAGPSLMLPSPKPLRRARRGTRQLLGALADARYLDPHGGASVRSVELHRLGSLAMGLELPTPEEVLVVLGADPSRGEDVNKLIRRAARRDSAQRALLERLSGASEGAHALAVIAVSEISRLDPQNLALLWDADVDAHASLPLALWHRSATDDQGVGVHVPDDFKGTLNSIIWNWQTKLATDTTGG